VPPRGGGGGALAPSPPRFFEKNRVKLQLLNRL